jgi:hypothetical protein
METAVETFSRSSRDSSIFSFEHIDDVPSHWMSSPPGNNIDYTFPNLVGVTKAGCNETMSLQSAGSLAVGPEISSDASWLQPSVESRSEQQFFFGDNDGMARPSTGSRFGEAYSELKQGLHPDLPHRSDSSELFYQRC